MNLKVLKLSTGEEVLCEVKSQDFSTTVVENPFVLILTGDGRMTPLPWMPYSNNRTFNITTNAIIAENDIKSDNQIYQMFLQLTGKAGIVQPNKGLIIPK